MSDEQYAKLQLLLKDVPKEFHTPFEGLAYELGHASGAEEVLNKLGTIVDYILPSIEKFEKRVVKDYEDYMYL
jgi:hypothetical protein